LVERQLPKLEVAGSKPVVRSVMACQQVSKSPGTGDFSAFLAPNLIVIALSLTCQDLVGVGVR